MAVPDRKFSRPSPAQTRMVEAIPDTFAKNHLRQSPDHSLTSCPHNRFAPKWSGFRLRISLIRGMVSVRILFWAASSKYSPCLGRSVGRLAGQSVIDQAGTMAMASTYLAAAPAAASLRKLPSADVFIRGQHNTTMIGATRSHEVQEGVCVNLSSG